MVKAVLYVAAALAMPLALAHPGEHHSQDFMRKERQELEMHARHIQRGLDACATHPKYLALKARGQARRADKAKHLRQKRGLTSLMRRDTAQLETYAAKSHNSSTSGYTIETDAATLFASNKNASCVLTPKVTEGPYYVTGEYYRTDVTDNQSGVPVHLEYQYIDISTCGAAEGLYIEHWHANATGVYSGIVASGNGVGTADQSNFNNTFLRGVQQTDSSGVAAFDTVFPGHYTGRTVHIHNMAHQNGTILSNNTFVSASVSSVGQVFFDQDLITEIGAVEPYSSNTQSLTTNLDDSIAAGEADNFDPFAEYAYLGDSISDGLLAWINIGIDMSASYSVSAGAHFYSTGGVAGEGGMGGGSGMGGGPMSGGSGGAPPSGAMPSGVPPTGAGGASGAAPTSAGSGTAAAPSGSVSASSASSSASSHSSSTAANTERASTTAQQAVTSSTRSSSSSRSVSSAVSSGGASRGRGGHGKNQSKGGDKGGKPSGQRSHLKTATHGAQPTGYRQRINSIFGVRI